jgi:hypothetical protein
VKSGRRAAAVDATGDEMAGGVVAAFASESAGASSRL